jgi:O-methyltransferase
MIDLKARYLDLLKKTLTDYYYDPVESGVREEGRDWPPRGCTMVGLKRLENVQHCIEDALARGVPGDVIETGVWRGGATIFMRAVLDANGASDRVVWVADSFAGLPPPDPRYVADRGDIHHTFSQLAVPLETVKENFAKFDLLDDNVRFLKGWFRDTLKVAPIEQLAVLRLDGDMYESTMDALVNLYPKLSRGGYLIVDDYGWVPNCRQAVEDFRRTNGIHDEIHWVDFTGVYWRRG